MCGIIGAASSRNVGKLLVQGLHKMEYRGYDSAGIALHQKDSILQAKKPWQGEPFRGRHDSRAPKK